MASEDVRFRLERLERQAQRTAGLRQPLYARTRLDQADRILDVGCGNGAVTRDLAVLAGGDVVGIDRDPRMVHEARLALANLKNVRVDEGDAHRLPYGDGEFDAAVCHLLLMWVEEPAQVVREMARVVRPGGVVLAAMEPDYGGKMHWPENPLVDQIFAGGMIERKKGDPHAGRKLRHWFAQSGLHDVEVGLSNPHVPSCEEDLATYEHEKGFYRRALLQNGLSSEQIDGWEREYLESLRSGEQLNFLPVLYAFGTKR